MKTIIRLIFYGFTISPLVTSGQDYKPFPSIESEYETGLFLNLQGKNKSDKYEVGGFTWIIYQHDSTFKFGWQEGKWITGNFELERGYTSSLVDSIEFKDIAFRLKHEPWQNLRTRMVLVSHHNSPVKARKIYQDLYMNPYDEFGKRTIGWTIHIVHPGGKCELWQSGFFSNGKKTGNWKETETCGPNEINEYLNDSLISTKVLFQDQVVVQEIHFLRGDTFGVYREYYPNKNLKLKGEYSQVLDHYETITLSNNPLDPYDTNDSSISIYVPVKNGRWEFYDENGMLNRTEYYEM